MTTIHTQKLKGLISQLDNKVDDINIQYGSENWITGVIEGGELNVIAGPNVEVVAGDGAIINSYTVPREQPEITPVAWPTLDLALPVQTTPNFVLVTIVDTGTQVGSPIYGYNLGAIKLYNGPAIPSPEDIRDEIFLGYVEWTGDSWQEVSSPNVINNTAHTLAEYITRVGHITNLIQGGGITEAAGHQMDQAAGVIWERNRNFINDPKDPHRESFAAKPAFSFRYTNFDFSAISAPQNTIDVANWDNAGTIEPVPGSSNTSTIQALFMTPGDNMWIVYGQTTYSSFSEAIAHINDFITVPYYLERSLLLGWIVSEKGKTDWDADESIFYRARNGGGQAVGAPFSPSTFTGALTTGYVPDPVTESRRSLIDDGTWQNRAEFVPYVNGNTYYPQQTVLVDGWLSSANTETTDYPAPVAAGPAFFVYAGTSPTSPVSAKQIIFGNRYTFGKNGWIAGYRANVVSGNRYVVYVVLDPTGTPIIEQISDFVANTTGWVDIPTFQRLILSGTGFDLVAIVNEPDPSPTTFNGNWNYITPNNPGTPSTGQMSHANQQLDQLRIHYIDDDSGDRTAEIQALGNGDIVDSGTGVRWSIQNNADAGTYAVLTVAPAVQSGADGVRNFIFETIVATAITRMVDANWWGLNPPASGSVQGLYIEDDVYSNIAPDTSAYGVDIFVQDATLSPDWDIYGAPGISSASAEALGGPTASSSALDSYPGVFMEIGSTNIVNTGDTVVNLDSEELDPDSNYSLSAGEITITSGGYYNFQYSIPVNDDGTAGTTRGRVFAWLERDQGSATWVVVPQSRGQDYAREASGGEGLNGGSIVQLSAGEAVRLVVRCSSTVDVSTESGESQLSLHRIRE